MKSGKFYEINVAQNGIHLFATDTFVRSYDEAKIAELLLLFKEKFPKEEKYEVSVTGYTCGATALSDEMKQILGSQLKK